MQFWLVVPWTPAEEMMELAKLADELGFDGLMGADHGFIPQSMVADYPYTEDGKPPITGDMAYPEVWTTIAAMSAVTKRIRFSCAVYVLPLRNPIEIAKATGTIARISNNRLVLGAGVGWMKEEFDVYGVDFKTRGKRMNETIEVLNKLWDGGYVEHHGEFFDFDPLQIAPAPTQRIPIWLGGASAPALRRAGRYAQGWIGNGNEIDDMPLIFSQLHEARVANERENEPFDITLALKGMASVDQMKQFQDQGATGTFMGFPDNNVSFDEKRKMLEQQALYMQQFK